VSTREEILQALASHPEGLTSRELAPLCPACECDPMIVARQVAMLSGDREIHPDGLRDGAVIWKAGSPLVVQDEPKLSLAGSANLDAGGRSAADHAKAIVQMRQASRQPPVRPRAAPVLPPVPMKDAPPKEGADMTIKDRITAALKEHGPMTTRELRKYVKDTAAPTVLAKAARETREFVRLGGGTRSGVYGLPGQKLAERKDEAPREPHSPAPRKPKVAKKPRKARRVKTREERPVLPTAKNGAAHFAIDELGAVGIEKGGEKILLEPEEIVRLRTFIDKTADLRGA
jgi:hypothetical protein